MDRFPWKPSIHMPRWASRINLGITAVRVERLLEISDEDAIAEGLESSVQKNVLIDDEPFYRVGDIADVDPRQVFLRLWDSINYKRGFGWDVNPWVWVVEFRRIPPEVATP